MGIAPYKTFTFDGVSSSAYGVYLTGEGVFDAPERAVEMIEIPNRNGYFDLDQGRFENIEVKYKIGMFDVDESNFATKVSNFRNWLCSKVGYVRLEDDYNPNEYRMAVYSGGLELKHDLLIAGEAEIIFNCKPQRWLTSGETATAVVSGGTLTNPTLFDSHPQLQLYGYGNISINNDVIFLDGTEPLGQIILKKGTITGKPSPQVLEFNALLNGGDAIYSTYVYGIGQGVVRVETNSNWYIDNDLTSEVKQAYPFTRTDTFAFGTASTINRTVTDTFSIYSGSDPDTYVSVTLTSEMTMAYDGNDEITITFNNASLSGAGASHVNIVSTSIYWKDIYGDSTFYSQGNPAYIDLDIGEAYKIENGIAVSINNAVQLPSDLPTLASGTNTITYDNTFTSVKVVPRWWKV